MQDHQNQPCDHPSCIMSSLLGMRNGIYYGGRVRFFHALVMTMLFKQGTIKDKMKHILMLTYEHARNLGLFVFLYKSFVCVLVKIHKKQSLLHNFIAGSVSGYLIFGRKKTTVNQQIVLYLLSRIIIGSATNLQKRGYFKKNIKAFPWLTAFCWGMVMFLFENDSHSLQSSLTSSMMFLYKESNKAVTQWTQLIPFDCV